MKEQATCCTGTVSEDKLLDQLDGLLDDYVGEPGGLIPVLQLTQHLFGYLPETALQKISLRLNIPFTEVCGVVSFYSFFTTVPRGAWLIRVCLGTACYVRGGKEVLAALKKELGIDVGQTTTDRVFSLDIGRCFGACGLAPAIMVNDTVHQRVKPEKISEILNLYRGKNPESANGRQ